MPPRLSLPAALFLCAAGLPASGAPPLPSIGELLGDPTPAQWRDLARFDRSLTRREFEDRLDRVFDPARGLRPFLRLGDAGVAVYAEPARAGEPVTAVRFAPDASLRHPPAIAFVSPDRRRQGPPPPAGRPLSGLRVAIEPADIGGSWAKMEDRPVAFAGYGRVNEGDLNLAVGRLLRDRLVHLGAEVFLVRDGSEPVLRVAPGELAGLAAEVMRDRPWLLPESYELQTASLPADSPRRLRVAEELLLTKTIETRARAALVRRMFSPDLTVVLQHNATPGSAEGRLNPVNRNIFFVNGAYTASELREPEQRFRLLTKLLEDSTPVEVEVAAAIAARFKAATGYPPVLSGNSANTRLVLPGNPYVVARNLAFNREHDGPVVVAEPYFMNEAETLARIAQGDYPGERPVAGRSRPSIFREYADCVAAGLCDAYGAAGGTGR